MIGPGNAIVQRMLDRLFASLASGPSLNCRPHSSRQRVDLVQLAAFEDQPPEAVLRRLLIDRSEIVIRPQVPRPPMSRASREPEQAASPGGPPPDAPGEPEPAPPPASASAPPGSPDISSSSADTAQADTRWSRQQSLLAKLSVIADDARTYEQETGCHVLHIGFPLVSLPPGATGGRTGFVSRRIVAPIAFIPINLTVQRGASAQVVIEARERGADRVLPNTALLAWLEQQTGKRCGDLFTDDEGQQPWLEIRELLHAVTGILKIEAPPPFVPGDSTAEASEGGMKAMPTATDVEPATGAEETADESATAEDDSEDDADAFEEIPELTLTAAPRSDDEAAARPAILLSAVLGLFPASNQGLLRDTQEMLRQGLPVGPIESFVDVKIDLDHPVGDAGATPATGSTRRVVSEERLVAPADPCQARAVRAARTHRGLVIHGPPGTGKSQTIANIIGDHLVRGERVLFVCDKRTALDVVANRLEHLGLGSLCALVHDPRRDQRNLYMTLRGRLEGLGDVRTDEKAIRRLEKLDAELQRIHDELAAFFSAVSDTPGDGEGSLHECIGAWMAESHETSECLDAGAVAGLRLGALDDAAADCRDILDRAERIGYLTNAWSLCGGLALEEYLGRSATTLREALDRCRRAAIAADATAIADMAPFTGPEPLDEQVQRRIAFAKRFESALRESSADTRARWATRPPDQIQSVHRRLQDLGPFLDILHAGPLDAELAIAARGQPLDLPRLNRDVAALTKYLEVCRHWYAFVCFGAKRAAAQTLNAFGLSANPESGERLHRFLVAYRARAVLSEWHREITGDAQGPEILPDVLRENGEVLALLQALSEAETLAPLVDHAKAALQGAPADGWLDALHRCAARAEALTALERELAASGLFDPRWLARFNAVQRQGQRATETLDALVEGFDTLEDMLRVRADLDRLPRELAAAIAGVLKLAVGAEEGIHVLRKAVLAAEISRRIATDARLNRMDAHRVETLFARYHELETARRQDVCAAVVHCWTALQRQRLLASTGTRLSSLGADLRRRLTTRGHRAMRLRQVVAVGRSVEGGDPLFDLCPVWMCSPESAAQIFPREPMFEAVIFDEASQCRLEEALPVLTRGRRVVIAGDPKQLPPTRFFESAITHSEDEDLSTDQQLFESQQGEIEDLLAAALNLSIEQRYLDVHYRSRNADLIGFSNEHFYGARLQPIPGHPANRTPFPPLTLYHAGGVYKDQSNAVEAQWVVRIVRDLLKRSAPPSIGVACFNLQQRDLIGTLLDEAAAEDPEFGARLAEARTRRGAGTFEGLFIKNLESVQGDERDHIIISTTFGPDEEGRFYRRFGPLGRMGGGRRLNVLVTRARHEVHIVTSIPRDVYRALPPVPPDQTPGGGWLLFSYLHYAERLGELYREEHPHRQQLPGTTLGTDPVQQPTQFPSRFVEELARHLGSRHETGSTIYWGNDGFCVDLALRHPQRTDDVTIGILCDGARFDRVEDRVEWDVFRTAVHQSQGWKLVRVWSPHFFRDPQRHIHAILEEVRQALDRERATVDSPIEEQP